MVKRDAQTESEAQEMYSMWASVLSFLCLELFGKEIAELVGTHQFVGTPVEQGYKIENFEMLPHEKALFMMTDCVHKYLEENSFRMVNSQIQIYQQSADGLRNVFWSLLMMNHPEVLGKMISVFEGLKIGTSNARKPPQGILEIIKGIKI